MTKKLRVNIKGWTLRIGAGAAAIAALYGCTQMNYDTSSQTLDRGGRVLAHVRMKQPTTWENRCRYEIDLLGGGHINACATGCGFCEEKR